MPARYFVTGAARGIGRELVRQLSAAGYSVFAGVRDAARFDLATRPGVVTVPLDVTSAAAAQALVADVRISPIDVLINNAGVGEPPGPGGREGANLAELDLEAARRVLEVNTLGPLRVTQALLPALRAGRRRCIVNISSDLGSFAAGVEDFRGRYAYRTSKAALNMLTRIMAAELADAGFTCVALHPGWVATDMGSPAAPLPVAASAGGLITLIEKLSPADNGGFFDYRGNALQW